MTRYYLMTFFKNLVSNKYFKLFSSGAIIVPPTIIGVLYCSSNETKQNTIKKNFNHGNYTEVYSNIIEMIGLDN